MFLYLHGFKTCRVNILMKVLHHLSQGLKWFLTYSWYFDSALLWCSHKYSYKKMCTWFHFRQQQKMKSFKELHLSLNACRNGANICRDRVVYLLRFSMWRYQKKEFVQENFSRRRQSATKNATLDMTRKIFIDCEKFGESE